MQILQKKECLVPGCTNEIINAHAISSSISLDTIVEKDKNTYPNEFNHLYNFNPIRRGQQTKIPQISKIGINDATASQCFCKVHDEIFFKIDNNGINTSYDVFLQSYRSLSIILNDEKNALLEMYNHKEIRKPESISLENVKIFLSIQKEFSPLLNHLDKEDVLVGVQNRIIFEISEYIDEEIARIENLSLYLLKLLINFSEKNFKIENYKLYTVTTENMCHTLFYGLADFKIPVAINTMKVCVIDNKKYNSYFIVIPYENKTIIIGMLPEQLLKKQEINDYINNVFINKLTILEFVESIIASNDNWYISPSIIRDDMSLEKRKVFEEDCMFNNERTFYKPYELSIFDNLRKTICEELSLDDEIKKISYIPKRENYETRYKRMIEKTIYSNYTFLINS